MTDKDKVTVELSPAPSYWICKICVPYVDHLTKMKRVNGILMMVPELRQMYEAIGEALEKAKEDPAVAYHAKYGAGG